MKDHTLELLIQIARGIAKQFGSDCEIVIHDLQSKDPERSILHIENGHVTNRMVGGAPSRVVLEAMDALWKCPDSLEDHLGYLTKTSDGKILKSSTLYIRDDKTLSAICFPLTRTLPNLSGSANP